jgi:hypothetical protein
LWTAEEAGVTRFVLYFVGWLPLAASLLTAFDITAGRSDVHLRELWPCAVWLLCFVAAFGLGAILGQLAGKPLDKR